MADIQLFKYDDLRLWSLTGGKPRRTAVAARRGSGDAGVHVLYASQGRGWPSKSKRPKAPIPR